MCDQVAGDVLDCAVQYMTAMFRSVMQLRCGASIVLVQPKQGMINGSGFVEHIETSTGDRGWRAPHQRRFVDDRATARCSPAAPSAS